MKHQKHVSILFIKTGETFPEELKNAFSAECRRRGTTMTKALARLIRKWLQNPTA